MNKELVAEKLMRTVRKGRRSTLREGPDPIDVHVGERIRLRRILTGVSQVELSEALGLSFQQVQKYERGANRVSASTLYRLAHALGVSVAFFFSDLSDVLEPIPPAAHDVTLVGRESLEFLRSYRARKSQSANSQPRQVFGPRDRR